MRVKGTVLCLLLMMGFANSMQAQGNGITVKGKVTDGQSGETLPGVNIILKGTTKGVSSDTDGHYQINVPSLKDTLVFSYIGYQNQNVPINGRQTVDVQLDPQAIQGEEVVVVGYGTQAVQDVTGSVSNVNSDDLNAAATGSVNQMLRGKASGLNLRQRTAQPGGGVSANIRGVISPQGNNNPLYVIDGVPITNNESSVQGLDNSNLGFYGGIDRDPLSYLNPSDIQSVTVLKDASATAIYGSAAANGVILITTKDGRAGEVQVEYRGSYTVQTPHDYIPLLNAQEFMRNQRRLAYDKYLYSNRIAPYGNTDPSSVSAFNALFSDSDINSTGVGTDWLGLVTEKGYVNEHNISLSGGGENTSVFGSLNYQSHDGVLKNSKLDKYAARLNLDQDFGEVVHLTVKTTASRQVSDNASSGASEPGEENYNMLQAAYQYSPTVGIRTEAGDFTSSFNPLIMSPAAFLTISDNSTTDHFFTAPDFEIELSPKLKVNVVGQADISSTNRSFYLPRKTNNAQLPDGMAQKHESRIENYTGETFVTYQNDFKNSKLKAVVGAGYYKTISDGFSLQGVGFFTDAFKYNNVGVASNIDQTIISSFKNERNKISQFARLNYTLHDKYIFSLVGRRDGSSIFSENHKYGYFPGGSFAWKLSNEDFLQAINQISELKIRVGYGLAGNESVLSGNSLQLYAPGNPALIGNTEYNGVALTQVANPDLTWEKNYTLNFGVDFGFWRNRVRGSVDYFMKTARDLLDYNPLPSNNAVGRVADNVGATRSRGFEVSLETQNISSNEFQWTSNLNVSHYKNKWLERNPKTQLADYIGVHDPIDAIYGWETNGIISSANDLPTHMSNAFPGNIEFVDQNGDGELNSEDVVQLGTSNPKWTVGLSNTFSYKNFEMSVYVYGNFDFMISNNYAPDVSDLSLLSAPENTTTYAKDVWSVNNTDGIYPGVADNPYSGSNPTGTNDFYLEDGSFIRLSNISLSYTLPTTVFGATSPLRSARLFVNVEDLGVITNYSGFDPEYTEPNPYPKSYSTTVGIELRF